MKKLVLLSISFLSAIALHAQFALPNYGFENWTNGEPDQWHTNNVPGSAVTITQSNDAKYGSSAVRGDIVAYNGGNVSPNLATDGSHPFAITQQYPTLNFYYKMHRINATDGLVIVLSVSDSVGNVVGFASAKLSNEATTYTPSAIPITWLSGTPHHMNIIISMEDTSGGVGTLGSYFLIDDISMGSFLSGINEVANDLPSVNVFPNPSLNSWNISADNSWIGSDIEIFDTQGRIVYNNVLASGTTTIDLDLPKGMYTLKLKNQQTSVAKKVIKL